MTDDLISVILFIMGMGIILTIYQISSSFNKKKQDMSAKKGIGAKINKFFRSKEKPKKTETEDNSDLDEQGSESESSLSEAAHKSAHGEGGKIANGSEQQQGELPTPEDPETNDMKMEHEDQEEPAESDHKQADAPATTISKEQLDKLTAEITAQIEADVRKIETQRIEREARSNALKQVRDESGEKIRNEERDKIKKEVEEEFTRDFEKNKLPRIRKEIRSHRQKEIIEELGMPVGEGSIRDLKFDQLKRKLATCKKIAEAPNEEELLKAVKDLSPRTSVVTAKDYLKDIWKKSSSHDVRVTQVLTGMETEARQGLYVDRPGLVAHYRDLQAKAADQEKVKKLLNVMEGNKVSTQLEHLLSQVRDGLKLGHAVSFVKAFKYLSPEEIKQLDSAYQLNVDRFLLIDAYTNEFAKITDFKYAKRLGFILLSVKLGTDLLALSGQETKLIEPEKIKLDYVRTILSAYLYTSLRDQEYLQKTFEESSEGTYKTVNSFDRLFGNTLGPININEKIENMVQVCSEACEQLKKLHHQDNGISAFDRLLVREFESVQHEMNKGREPSAEELARYYGMIFNVAFYAKDFIRVKFDDPRRAKLYKNATLLAMGGDVRRVDHKSYVEDDLANSSRPANMVVKAARKLGAQNLNIIVDDFYLNDNHLS